MNMKTKWAIDLNKLTLDEEEVYFTNQEYHSLSKDDEQEIRAKIANSAKEKPIILDNEESKNIKIPFSMYSKFQEVMKQMKIPYSAL